LRYPRKSPTVNPAIPNATEMKGHNHSGIDDTVIFLHTLDFYVTTR
jgi:hypothetical protein